jgi:hypothetical protein
MTVSDWSTLRKLMWLRGSTGGGGSPLTVTGPTPLLMPGALSKPLKKATFSIEPVQAGSGDPSPNNVRPITGWTGCTAWVTGKNLIDLPNDPAAPYYVNYLSDELLARLNALPRGVTLYVGYSLDGTPCNNCLLRVTYDDDTTADLRYNGGTLKEGHIKKGQLFTMATIGVTYAVSDIWVSTTQNAGYTPYSGSSLSVEFPESVGTVYSGAIDPVTGQGVVTHKLLDISTISENLWQKSSSFPGGFYATLEWPKKNIPFICSHAKTALTLQEYLKGTCFCDGSINFRLLDPGAEKQDWLDFIAAQKNNGTPITICAELLTPIPFTVPPQSLTPPAGDAYIWADCGGSAEVTYIGKA